MKIRNGFVSNSSSTAFIITNTSDVTKTLVDFVEENPQLVERFCEIYDWNDFTQEQMIKSAKENDQEFHPDMPVCCIFGDRDGTVVGHVFDYILRDGGKSENFKWQFDHWLR